MEKQQQQHRRAKGEPAVDNKLKLLPYITEK